MDLKVLLALDGSDAAMRAVAHVGEIFAGKEGGEVWLYYVVGIPPRLMEHGGAQPGDRGMVPRETLAAQTDWESDLRLRVEDKIFGPAKRLLEGLGADSGSTQIRTRISEDAHPDVALRIIQKAEAGGFSAVVLGRRGRSALREFALGTVTSKVIHHIKSCAVWIVD